MCRASASRSTRASSSTWPRRRRRLHRQGPAGGVRLRERDADGPDEPGRLGRATPSSCPVPRVGHLVRRLEVHPRHRRFGRRRVARWCPSRWPGAPEGEVRPMTTETIDDEHRRAPDPRLNDSESAAAARHRHDRHRPHDAAVVVGDDQPRRDPRAARRGDRPAARRAARSPLAAEGARRVPGQDAARGRRHPRRRPGPGRADGAAHRGRAGRRAARPPDRRGRRGRGPSAAPRGRGLLRPAARQLRDRARPLAQDGGGRAARSWPSGVPARR